MTKTMMTKTLKTLTVGVRTLNNQTVKMIHKVLSIIIKT